MTTNRLKYNIGAVALCFTIGLGMLLTSMGEISAQTSDEEAYPALQSQFTPLIMSANHSHALPLLNDHDEVGTQPNFLPPTPTPLSSSPNEQNTVDSSAVTSAPIIDVPLDIVILQDETGSMRDDIGNLNRLTPQIWDSIAGMAQAGFRMSVVGFRDFGRSPWGNSGDWVYRRYQDFTTSRAEFSTAVNRLSAAGGNDDPESQYAALYYALSTSHPCIDSNRDGDCLDANDTSVGQQPSFRAGAKRVILLATDAPFHDPNNTPGYPGPDREAVLAALRNTNTTLIGLVPGGAGRLWQVDDLAGATGGSVQDTGSSGQAVAEAIAAAIGDFSSLPSSDSTLSITFQPIYTIAESIRPLIEISNLSTASQTYLVKTSLFKEGALLRIDPQNVTLSPGEKRTLTDINLGIYSAGRYQLFVELEASGKLLSTKSAEIAVVAPEAIHLVENQSKALTDEAGQEFDQMTGIVGGSIGESIINIGVDLLEGIFAEYAGKLLGAFVPDGIANTIIGELNEELTEIGYRGAHVDVFIREYSLTMHEVVIPEEFSILNPSFELIAKAMQEDGASPAVIADTIADLKKTSVNALTGRFKPWFQSRFTNPEMTKITQRAREFDDLIASTPFAWDKRIERVFADGKACIANVTETYPVASYRTNVFGFEIGSDVTLLWQYDKFKEVFNLKDTLGTVALVLQIVVAIVGGVLAIIAILGTGGLSAPVVAAGAAKIYLTIKAAGDGITATAHLTAIIIILAMTGTLGKIAPVVTSEHQATLSSIKHLLDSGSFSAEVQEVAVETKDGITKVNTRVKNIEPAHTVAPLISSIVYSVDGRPVDCDWNDEIVLTAGADRETSRQLDLPMGKYKVVTALHSAEQLAIDVDHTEFSVNEIEDLTLSVSLNQHLFASGDVIQAEVSLVNRHPASTIDDLLLVIESNDGTNFAATPVNLDAGEGKRFRFTFAARKTGGHLLRASLLAAGFTVIKQQDIGYVVDDGVSIAVNTQLARTYPPNAMLTIPISVSNYGTVASSAEITLVTQDRLDNFATVHSETKTLDLSPGQLISVNATVLPLPRAQPGQYRLGIYLNGAIYATYDFAVAAIDTLFATLHFNAVIPEVGGQVAVNIDVTDSTYAHVDANVSAQIWQPNGSTIALTLSRIGPGRYQGQTQVQMAGTHQITVGLQQSGYRLYADRATFIADHRSHLKVVTDGRPVLNATRPISLTVMNEQNASVGDAIMIIRTSDEYYFGQTDSNGQLTLNLSPQIAETYQIEVSRAGFSQVSTELPVWIAPDVVPPSLLVLNAPRVTNEAFVTLSGVTERGVTMHINRQAVTVDSKGFFSSDLPLAEGTNLFELVATDAANNTRQLIHSVVRDTQAPELSISNPIDGALLKANIVHIRGSTEPNATVVINGFVIPTEDGVNEFGYWFILSAGKNQIEISAMDAAGNRTVRTLAVITAVNGDCNGDQTVGAADLTALALEFFDGDDNNDPNDTPNGAYPGTPACDANEDGRIGASDLTCIALIFFSGPGACQVGQSAAAHSQPTLVIPDDLVAEAGGQVTVPIVLQGNGAEVSSLLFSIDYDETWLTFDPADHDEDGVPDAIVFNLPDHFVRSVTIDLNDASGELDIMIASFASPAHVLPEGELLSITFGLGSSTDTTEAIIAFAQQPEPSLGDRNGYAISGSAQDGVVRIVATGESGSASVLHLPMISR